MTTSTTRVHFTDKLVKDWLEDAQAGKRPEYQDDENPRLRARVSPGRVAWSALLWSPNLRKTVRHQIGTHLEHNVKAARIEAARVAQAVTVGKDVSTERKDLREQADVSRLTVNDALENYIAQRADTTKPLAPATVANYRRSLPALLGGKFHEPIARLDSKTVLKLYRARSKKVLVENQYGTVTEQGSEADAELALRALTRLCRVLGLPNPVLILRTNRLIEKREPRRGRLGSIEAQSLVAWMIAHHATLDAHTLAAQNLRMMLFAVVTGLRILTIRQMRWEWINWRSNTLTLPGKVIKTRRDHELPFPQILRDLFKPLRAASGYLFPQQGNPEKFQAFTYPPLPIECSPHDGRKIITAVLALAGAEEVAIKLLAGHMTEDVTYRKYLLTNPWSDLLRIMRPASDAVSAFYSAKIGDKKVIAEMAEAYAEHAEAAREAKQKSSVLYRQRRTAKKRARRAA